MQRDPTILGSPGKKKQISNRNTIQGSLRKQDTKILNMKVCPYNCFHGIQNSPLGKANPTTQLETRLPASPKTSSPFQRRIRPCSTPLNQRLGQYRSLKYMRPVCHEHRIELYALYGKRPHKLYTNHPSNPQWKKVSPRSSLRLMSKGPKEWPKQRPGQSSCVLFFVLNQAG